MLAVSSLRSNGDEREREVESFSVGGIDDDGFLDFSEGNFLDSIDFDDLFVGIEDGDGLPDLEMDPEILAEFSASGGEESEMNSSSSVTVEKVDFNSMKDYDEEEEKVSGSGFGISVSWLNQGEETVNKRDESVAANPSPKQAHEGRRKSSAQSKHPHGKRKVKVDWTPELHRRFVQAVEQLGVDKAVPSRILELMGIDCLTRHNIASHLQKYRSHRKHLIAREAEAASLSQRRKSYGGVAGGGSKIMSPWLAPTMGFPPMTPFPHFRPLHVWGHPSMDQSLMHMWPKHLAPSPSPPLPPPPVSWIPTPHPPPTRPPSDPSFWHSHHQRMANSLTPGTPCFPPPVATPRFPIPPVTGIPPRAIYRVDHGVCVPTTRAGPHPSFDFQPSKESIDAAIGDALSKPWLPLPLGLKPPSLDGVLVELQRQGIPKIPPSCA